MRKLAASVFIIRIFGAALGFIVVASITNLLPQDLVGKYFYIISMTTVFSAIASLGLNNIVLRRCSTKSISAGSVVNTALVFVLIASILIVPIFYLFLIENDISHSFFFLTIILIAVIGIVSHGMQGIGKIVLSVIYGSILHQIAMLCIIYFNPPSDTIELLDYYFLSFLVTFIAVVSTWYFTRRDRLEVDKNLSLYLSPAFSLMLFQVFQEFNVAIGQILLGLNNNTKELAVYVVCFKVATIISFGAFALNKVYASKFASAFQEKNFELLNQLVVESRNLGIIFVIPIILLSSYFSKEVLIFFGNEYSSFGWFLTVIMLLQIIALLNGNLAYLMVMCGFEKSYKNHIILTSILSFLIGWWVVDYSPLVGALLAFSVVQFYPFIYSILFINKKLKIRYWRLGS